MNHQMHVVEQNPLAGIAALGVDRFPSEFLQGIFDMVDDCTNMDVNRAGTDQEVVGKVGHFAQIEQNDIRSLFLGCKKSSATGDGPRKELAGITCQREAFCYLRLL